jgi:hypothetical protein
MYSHDRSSFFCSNIRGPIVEYINCSQKRECGNWKIGRAVSFLGIFVSNIRYSVFAVCTWRNEYLASLFFLRKAIPSAWNLARHFSTDFSSFWEIKTKEKKIIRLFIPYRNVIRTVDKLLGARKDFLKKLESRNETYLLQLKNLLRNKNSLLVLTKIKFKKKQKDFFLLFNGNSKEMFRRLHTNNTSCYSVGTYVQIFFLPCPVSDRLGSRSLEIKHDSPLLKPFVD